VTRVGRNEWNKSWPVGGTGSGQNAIDTDGDVTTLRYSLKVLLENLVRHADGLAVTDDVAILAPWDPAVPARASFRSPRRGSCCRTARGVPAVVDLAAMRDAVEALGAIRVPVARGNAGHP
jgi:aconitate hydratase